MYKIVKIDFVGQKAYFERSEEEAGLLAEWRSRSSAEHEALYRRIMSGESLAELLEWQNHFDRNKRIGRFASGLKNVNLFG